MLYGTTQKFLEHFGLRDLDDMPKAAELRLQAAALKTAEDKHVTDAAGTAAATITNTESNEGQTPAATQ
jgi:hypothetical protein